MSTGDDKKQSTTTQTSNLMPGVAQGLQKAQSDAANLYSSGNLFKPFAGSTVTQPSFNTENANNKILFGVDQSAANLGNSFNGISGIASGTGYNAEQNDALTQLRSYASGGMDGLNNPAFQAVVKQSQTAATDAVNAGASAAGRYGSGIAQGNVAREVGDVTNRALANQMNIDTQNRLGAVSGLFAAGQQGTQNRFTAAGMLPGLYDASLDPYRAQAGVGAQQEDLQARTLQDQIRQQQGPADQQRQAIEWLQAISAGNGNLGGSQTATVSAPGQNPFLAGLGGAAAGYGSAGVGGALLGGGAGLLGGIFG